MWNFKEERQCVLDSLEKVAGMLRCLNQVMKDRQDLVREGKKGKEAGWEREIDQSIYLSE